MPSILSHAVQTEMERFTRSQTRRRRQLPLALLVGALAGLLAVAFRLGLELAEAGRAEAVERLHPYGPIGLAAFVAMVAAGVLLSVWSVKRLAPEAAGSGIPHIKAVVDRLRPMVWQRVLPVKFLGGILGIGSGLALGREGPTVQMGAALGELVSERAHASEVDRRTLIVAGSGAGLAAAFNAPLSGMVFVLEELQGDFAPSVFLGALSASVTADLVTRALLGQGATLSVPTAPLIPLPACAAFLVLGAMAGLMGVLYNRSLLGSLDLFEKLRWVGVAAAGLGLGLAGWFAPTVVGGGYGLLHVALSTPMALGSLAWLYAARFGLTAVSYGCGAPGGIFAPLLVLGAVNGLVVGQLAEPYLHVPPYVFAVVAMGAYFSAIVRAPLTGIVLILEMTLDYNLMLPLLVACTSAYMVASRMGEEPVYEALLRRDLERSRPQPAVNEPVVVKLAVPPGHPLADRAIRELGLPPGCLITLIQREDLELVPNGDTVLRVGDRVTAVVAPEAADALSLLHAGNARSSLSQSQ